jgi:hypothetical protein
MIWKIAAAQCDGLHTNARFTKVAQHARFSALRQYSFCRGKCPPRQSLVHATWRCRVDALPRKMAAFSIELRNAQTPTRKLAVLASALYGAHLR